MIEEIILHTLKPKIKTVVYLNLSSLTIRIFVTFNSINDKRSQIAFHLINYYNKQTEQYIVAYKICIQIRITPLKALF